MMSLVACSGSKSTNEAEGEEAGVELADADEFSEDGDTAEASADDWAEESGDETAASGEESFAEEAPMEEVADNSQAVEQESAMEESPMMEEPAQASSSVAMSGQEGTWTVSKNETLMIIAFKIYGDYDKWRQIAQMNSDKLGGRYQISTGMTLRYDAPAQPFVWNPEGNPYLIQRGDTLGSISNTTYGTKQYWKNIWTNNKPLIKDPNRIFAGFTIYTPVIEGRDVANDM